MEPKFLEGARRILLMRLVANGLAQSALAISMALAIEATLAGPRSGAGAPTWQTFAMLLFAAGAYVLLRAWQRRDAEALGLSYVHDLRMALFRQTCSLPISSSRLKLGPTMTRLSNDLLSVKNWISYGVSGCVVAAVTVSASIAFLAHADLRLGLASLLAISVCTAIAAMPVPSLSESVRAARVQRGRLSRLLGEKVLCRHAIQHLGRVDVEAGKIARESRELTRLLTRRGLYSGMLRFSSDAALPLSVCMVAAMSVIWPAAAGAQGGSNMMLAWVFVMGIAVAQLQEAFRAWDYRVNFHHAMRKIRSILALEPIPQAAEAPPMDTSNPDATFDLSWNPGSGTDPVVLRLNRGQVAELSDGSSSERSALLRRIARMDQPGAEEARIGGRAIGDVPLAEYREIVGLVSPQIPLQRGSLGGNLRKAARPPLAEERIAAACEVSNVFEGASGASGALDIPVGEAGAGLDSTLAARARLARALVRDPLFLLIDDPVLSSSAETMQSLARHASSRGMGVLVSTAQS